jgi:hypothetical protein
MRELCRDFAHTENEAGKQTLTLTLTEKYSDTETETKKEKETETEAHRHLAFDTSSMVISRCQDWFGAESVCCRCEPQCAVKAHLSAHSALTLEVLQTLHTLPMLRRWMDWISSNP